MAKPECLCLSFLSSLSLFSKAPLCKLVNRREGGEERGSNYYIIFACRPTSGKQACHTFFFSSQKRRRTSKQGQAKNGTSSIPLQTCSAIMFLIFLVLIEDTSLSFPGLQAMNFFSSHVKRETSEQLFLLFAFCRRNKMCENFFLLFYSKKEERRERGRGGSNFITLSHEPRNFFFCLRPISVFL